MDDRDDKKKEAILHGSEAREKEGIKTKDAANYALGLYESFRGKNPTFLMETKNFIIIGSIPKTLFQAKDEMTIAQYREGNINTYAKEDFFRVIDEYVKENSLKSDPELPFDGCCLLGYIGYDMVSKKGSPLSRFPGAFLFEPSVYFVMDKAAGQIIHSSSTEITQEIPSKLFHGHTFQKERTFDEEHGTRDKFLFELESIPSEKDFIQMVHQVLERIKRDEANQVVLSRQLKSRGHISPISLYRILREINPSPFMFIMEFDGKSLVGASPELLLRVNDGIALTRPIAGTRRRGKDLHEDDFFEMEMLFDDKERQEHLSLLDLSLEEFNDICLKESIKVSKYFEVERYNKVMHLVSQVEGKLCSFVTPVQALKTSFPAGTVTGTPKNVAIKIIDEVEPISRGPYGGAIGYIGFNGNLEMSIAIRTFMQTQEELAIQVGAGIVAGSIPEREFLETQNKAAALVETLKIAIMGRDKDA
ncbi:MAG: chorismate-binding protein [Acetomicrobium sp.]